LFLLGQCLSQAIPLKLHHPTFLKTSCAEYETAVDKSSRELGDLTADRNRLAAECDLETSTIPLARGANRSSARV
jgi:hypothetical protein